MSGIPFGRIGDGPRVVCVHGSGSSGAMWLPLTMEVPGYEYILVDRPNHGTFAQSGPSTIEAEARGVAALLGDGAHLLGTSYGGVVAMVAATLEPERVLSLTVNEPPALQLARGTPAADDLLERFADGVYPPAEGIDEDEWGRRWDTALGFPPEEAPLTEEQRAAVRAMMWEQPAWEVPIDLDALAAVPVLAISGGWHSAFEAVCDAIAERTGAQRLRRPGAGHSLGEPATWAPAAQALWESVRA